MKEELRKIATKDKADHTGTRESETKLKALQERTCRRNTGIGKTHCRQKTHKGRKETCKGRKK